MCLFSNVLLALPFSLEAKGKYRTKGGGMGMLKTVNKTI